MSVENKEFPHWEKTLKEFDYRLTKPRRVILDILNKTDDHLSAEDIYQKVYETYPAIGLTTVYRTLELLVQIGLVLKFDFGDGRARFELNIGSKLSKGHHHHLICSSCHRIIDYTEFIEDEVELLTKTEKGLSERYNFDIQSHIIAFYGLCDECRKFHK